MAWGYGLLGDMDRALGVVERAHDIGLICKSTDRRAWEQRIVMTHSYSDTTLPGAYRMRLRLALLVIASFPVTGLAQSTVDSLNLNGRTNLSFGFGLTGSSQASVSPTSASASTTSEVASLAFSHWVRPEVAIQVSTAMVGASSGVGAGAQANATIPVLFGFSYSPRALAITPAFRPYVSAAAGPYMHFFTDALFDHLSARTETHAGARLGAGVNWFVARHFVLSVDGHYHAVQRFVDTDASTSRVSGFGMSFGLGFAWGGGADSTSRLVGGRHS